MPGPAPKPAATRQRTNRTTTAATFEAAPAARAELPPHRVSAITCQACPLAAWKHTRGGFDEAEVEPHDYVPRELGWRAATRKWWETIWASPIAAEWVDADVPGLLALAVLVDEFWTTADRGVHAEIRMASREFGLSPLSRRSLQWEIKRLAEPAKAPPPTRRPGRASLSVLSGRAS